MYTIVDCYTDEPAGLGVPPYLGVYPRYIAGSIDGAVNYITIDDLRLFKKFSLKPPKTKPSQKTNISVYNLTNNCNDIESILRKTDTLIVVLGVHTPGKYLSARPGTLHEIKELLSDVKCRMILTGPAVYGTQLQGGKFFEKTDLSFFDEIKNYDFSYEQIKNYAVRGAEILSQIPDTRIIEIETSQGCLRKPGCSFCTEPIKHKLEFRQEKDILSEIEEFYNLGARHFRLGKQSCFYSYPDPISLLRQIRKRLSKIKVLHIDNVNPNMVLGKRGTEITKAIVKYCTAGNIAAFGVESFDPEVIKENNLNTTPRKAIEAIRVLNKFGAKRGDNGMPRYLPGINIILGLKGESKKTFDINLSHLKEIVDSNLLLRRINIRQVSIFENTLLHKECGNKYLKKNKKYYWKFRDNVRKQIDLKMLQRLVPKGTILKALRAEVYDGKTTFFRQLGTYPLILGAKGRYKLKDFYNAKVTGHMLRSIIGEVF